MLRSRIPGAFVLAGVIIGLVNPAQAGGGAGEISVYGSYTSGDFGTGVDADVQATIVRYAVGDLFQFRVDVPMLRVKRAMGVAYTGLGPTPIGEKGEMWRQEHDSHHDSGGMEGMMQPFALDETLPSSGSTWTSGAGDLRMAVSRRIVGGGVKLYRFDIIGEVKLPTADENDGLGTGKADYRLGMSGEYRFWSATGFAGVGWNKLGDPDWGEFNDVLDAYIGFDSDPFAGGKLIFSSWLEGFQEVIDGAGNRAALGIGVRTTGKIRWRAQASTGLGGSSEDLTVLLGVSFGLHPTGPGVRGIQR